MFQSIRVRRMTGSSVEVQMAPLIDMVFILLIFFLVTTTFVRETGVRIERPRAVTGEKMEKKTLMIGLDPQGRVYAGKRRVDLLQLRSLVEKRLRGCRDLTVLLVADKATPAGMLVRIIDECRIAGAKRVAVATRKK